MPLASVLLGAIALVGTPSTFPCSCSESGGATRAQRIHTTAASFLVPRGSEAVHVCDDDGCESLCPDGECLQWTHGADAVSFSYFATPVGNADAGSDGRAGATCHAAVASNQVVVTFEEAHDASGATAHVEVALDDHSMGFDLTAKTTDDLCDLVRVVVPSIRVVNDWRKLEVLDISRDLAAFDYRNEIGYIRTATVGDIVTRELGLVVRIDEEGVDLAELILRGGEWVQVPRRLTRRANTARLREAGD